MSAKALRALRWATLLTTLMLGAVVVMVLSQATPSSEAVRLRNALLIAAPDPSIASLRPPDRPAGFVAETEASPRLILAAAQQVRKTAGEGEVALARALASHLVERLRDGGRISGMDIETTYRAIMESGRGYCADVVDAYIALALAAGLTVRSWAFSFDGFGGHGHVVVEIFDLQRDQWVMLDVFNNVMPLDAATGEPLAVARFLALFRNSAESVRFEAIGPGRLGFSDPQRLVEYYRRGINEWYFWNGNNVVSRDGSVLVRAASHIAEPLAELVAVGLGVYPGIVPLVREENAAQIERMQRLGTRLRVAAVAAMLLVLLLGVELALLARASRSIGARRTGEGA